jgi:acetyl-CoA C-acetyltransferase
MTDVAIVAAVRTPVGSFNGAFASVPAHELGRIAIKEALKRANLEGRDVSEVILGQILSAAQGQNPARQASINAGIPVEVPAWGVNQLCGSGLRSVALGYQAIINGDSAIVIAGGQESMSMAPHAAYLRAGQKMGGLEFVDTMIKDGLWDAFNGYHMGNTAENVAREWQITREQQDHFAVASQNKAEAARKAGRFKDEIATVTIKERKGEKIVDTDEFIRDGVTYDAIKDLRPAFLKEGGTVTAANASGINDGAGNGEAQGSVLKPLTARVFRKDDGGGAGASGPGSAPTGAPPTPAAPAPTTASGLPCRSRTWWACPAASAARRPDTRSCA